MQTCGGNYLLSHAAPTHACKGRDRPEIGTLDAVKVRCTLRYKWHKAPTDAVGARRKASRAAQRGARSGNNTSSNGH